MRLTSYLALICVVSAAYCHAGSSADSTTPPRRDSSAAGQPSPARASAGGLDFRSRCMQPGVLKCIGFDDAADIAGRWGDNSGVLPGAAAPAIDTSVRASGRGSLKFTIPSRSGANTSGSYFTNFSSDLATQFDEGQEFYVQWRQRFSPELLDTRYEGGGGFKQIIIGSGDRRGRIEQSCSALEVVLFNYAQDGVPVMYNSCTGSSSHQAYDGFYQPFGAYDFKIQNGRTAPYCLYSQGRTTPKRYAPPDGNCVRYAPNEWMTFQIRIKPGVRVGDEFIGSEVTLWIAREGSPSELVIDWGPYNLTAGPESERQRFGKLWLLPYNTGKNPSQEHATAYTWYDELIISRRKILDP